MYLCKKNNSATQLLILFSVCTLLLNSVSTQAKNAVEDAYLEDFPVILSASRLEQPLLETPASVTVIDRALIEQSGARHIPELFRYVPGMQLGHATDNTSVVVYHGLGDRYSRRVQVLIDGRSVYTPAFGGVAWENLPITINDIEKIEVIRGPNAAVYGSNSFSAVISITTRFTAGTATSSFSTMVENSQNNTVHGSWSNSDGPLEYAVSSFFYTDEGDTNNNPKAEADDDRRRAMNLSLSYQLSPLDHLHLDTGVLDGSGKTGFESDPTDELRNTERDYNYLKLKYDHQFENGDNLYIQFFNTQEKFKEDEFTLPVALAENQPDILTAYFANEFRSSRRELELVYTPESWDLFRYVAGGSIRQDTIQSPSNLLNNESINVSRAFINTETRLTNNTLLGIGGMFENHDYSGNSFSPKLSLIRVFDSNYSLRFIASQATRAPIAFEQNGHFTTRVNFDPTALSSVLNQLNTIGSPIPQVAAASIPNSLAALNVKGTQNLKNEEQTSLELGFKAIFDSPHNNYIDFRLFYDELENLINEYDRVNGSNLYTTEQTNIINAMAALEGYQSPALGADTVNSINELGREFRRFIEVELFKNFVDLKKYGAEIEYQQHITDTLQINSGVTLVRMKINNSSAEQQAIFNSGLSNIDISNRIHELPATAPRHAAYSSLTYRPNNLASFNIAYHYMGNSSWLGDGEPNLGIQRMINVYTQTQHPLGRGKLLKVGFGIQNLSNDNFIDYNPRNESEIISYFRMGLDF